MYTNISMFRCDLKCSGKNIFKCFGKALILFKQKEFMSAGSAKSHLVLFKAYTIENIKKENETSFSS